MFKIKKSKLIKSVIFGTVLVLTFGFGFLILVKAQEPGPPKPPPKICGDGIIQSPNDENQYEKCDDGVEGVPTETDRCTADCGQKLLGWAWADSIGWVSLNNQTCDLAYLGSKYQPPYEDSNYQVCDPQPQPVAYSVDALPDDTIEGWAWSDNAGWICFGVTCDETCGGDCSGELPQSELAVSVDLSDPDKENPQLLGWAKIVVLGEDGWISLNCKNENDNIDCFKLTEFQTASNYQVRLGKSIFGKDGGQQETRLTLKGWAWNDHMGWLRFDPDIAELGAWLQTKYSDIYARSYLQGAIPAPAAVCNATYRILAGGDTITNFCSAQGEDWKKTGVAVNFPAAETLYSNVLGRLDVNGLICDFEGNPTCVNRYGTTVKNIASSEEFTGQFLSGALGNKIYYHDGDLVLNDSVKFVNGNSVNFESGAGTVIIDGNLDILGDITYEPSGQLTSFKNLASVAWIVRGDLRIAPNVAQLAGNFIVLGGKIDQEGNLPECQEDGESQRNEVFGCGQIYTCCNPDSADSAEACGPGSGEESCFSRLTVSGLMMAKKFYFDRTYFNPDETPIQGSEVIIYDGRLLANTPPGLSDFAKALPIWRSGSLVQ